ncbi:MAG: hypothetical protein ACRDT2_04595 [Natronosporangium sp.]
MAVDDGEVDWGTVPAWVGAIGSLFVAFVIGGGLLYEIKLRRMADERAAAERYDASAAQARLVSVGGGIAKTRGGKVSVRNDGDAPIRNIAYAVVVRGPDGEARRVAARSSKPRQPFVGAHSELRADIISAEVVDPRTSSIEVEFTDLHGRRWALTDRDELRAVHYEPEEPDHRHRH